MGKPDENVPESVWVAMLLFLEDRQSASIPAHTDIEHWLTKTYEMVELVLKLDESSRPYALTHETRRTSVLFSRMICALSG